MLVAAATAAAVVGSALMAPDVTPVTPPSAAVDVPIGLRLPALSIAGARSAAVVALAAETAEPDEPDVTPDDEPTTAPTSRNDAPPTPAASPVTHRVTAVTPRPAHRARPPAVTRTVTPPPTPTTVTPTRRDCS